MPSLDLKIPLNTPVWQQESVIQHCQLLLFSFQHWLHYPLVDTVLSPEESSRHLFTAPFVLVSHGTEAEPIFNYGNQKALELWEITWEEFTRMPSRQSAENTAWEDRDRLLAETAKYGFVQGYSGDRIARSGRRFRIEDVTIWNVIDRDLRYCGQAAIYSKITPLSH
ncbi:MAG: MEKHLA domain-containing protein [Spirulina sp.]